MRLQPQLDFLQLGWRKDRRVRVLGSSAVPDILRKLDALRNTQARKVGS